MSSLIPNLKFLIDENVKRKLSDFLKTQGFDVKLSPKSIPDSKLAAISKEESRVLVTNDWDFENCTKDQIFSIIILNVPQSETETLIEAYNKLLNECNKYEEKIIILHPESWEASNLLTEIKI